MVLRRASFLARHSDAVGIQIGGGGLRIVYTRQAGLHKEILDAYGYDIGGLKEDDVADKIKMFLKSIKVKNPYAVLVIPSHLAITKNIEIPSQDPKEIADIMNLQAARHTPYAREEIIIDYKTIGTYRINYTKILLAIVTREIIRRQLNIVNKAGVEIQRVCFSSEVVGKFLSNIFKLNNDDFPSGLLYIDSSFSYFNIVFKDESIFSRSIPIGSKHFDDDYTRYAGQFVEETRKSIEVYRNEGIESVPQRIILLSAPDKYKGLASFLSSTVGIPSENTSFIDRFIIKDKAGKLFAKEAEELEDKFRRIQLLKRYLSQRGTFLETLDKVYKNIPPTVKVTELRFNKENESVSIKGTAGSMTTVYSFIDSLSNEELFKDIKTRYTTKRREGNKEVADFELGITLNK
ncbi:MAG: hypothetical protein B1H08_06500 [Candidatus Omnitrophica bacterium 4484_171]|nr:MAG: hypothetical protein B1H08_06500 [Candidatus Omnitrophica bacterium 4484_171]